MVIPREFKFIGFGTLAAGFGPMLGSAMFYHVRGELGNVFRIEDLIVFSLITYPIALSFTSVFGLPLFFLARRFGLVKWWSAVGCGLLVGCVVQFIVLGGTAHLDNMLMYSAEGVASALLFFLVWRLGNRA